MKSKACVWADIFHNFVLLLFICAKIITAISLSEENLPKDIKRELSKRIND